MAFCNTLLTNHTKVVFHTANKNKNLTLSRYNTSFKICNYDCFYSWVILSYNNFTGTIEFLLLIFNILSRAQLVYCSWHLPMCFESSHYCSTYSTIFSIRQPLHQSYPPKNSWHLIFFIHHNIPCFDHLSIAILHLNLKFIAFDNNISDKFFIVCDTNCFVVDSYNGVYFSFQSFKNWLLFFFFCCCVAFGKFFKSHIFLYSLLWAFCSSRLWLINIVKLTILFIGFRFL